MLEPLEQLDHKEPQAQQAILEQLDLQVPLVPLEPQDHKEYRELQAQLE
jgi:hypothetical protein